MTTAPSQPVSLPTDLLKELTERAKAMNLTLEAYLRYLMTRASLNPADSARFDRHAREVFGKQGELIRRLAK